MWCGRKTRFYFIGLVPKQKKQTDTLSVSACQIQYGAFSQDCYLRKRPVKHVVTRDGRGKPINYRATFLSDVLIR